MQDSDGKGKGGFDKNTGRRERRTVVVYSLRKLRREVPKPKPERRGGRRGGGGANLQSFVGAIFLPPNLPFICKSQSFPAASGRSRRGGIGRSRRRGRRSYPFPTASAAAAVAAGGCTLSGDGPTSTSLSLFSPFLLRQRMDLLGGE